MIHPGDLVIVVELPGRETTVPVGTVGTVLAWIGDVVVPWRGGASKCPNCWLVDFEELDGRIIMEAALRPIALGGNPWTATSWANVPWTPKQLQRSDS